MISRQIYPKKRYDGSDKYQIVTKVTIMPCGVGEGVYFSDHHDNGDSPVVIYNEGYCIERY